MCIVLPVSAEEKAVLGSGGSSAATGDYGIIDYFTELLHSETNLAKVYAPIQCRVYVFNYH